MKKLISVLSLVLVLVFSCVLTSFADEYTCDIVPDSPYIWGLQVTDNESGFVVQSAGRKAVMKASSASSIAFQLSAFAFCHHERNFSGFGQ